MLPSEIPAQIAAALAPGRFFVKPPLSLRIEENPSETRRWELFKGELLPPEQTREEKTFHAWLVYLDEPDKPAMGATLAVRWDREEGKIHITRGFAVHGHEAYGDGNVIQTRPAIQWREERVATIDLTRNVRHETEISEQVAWNTLKAVVGTSRLAITSVESPHPEWSQGRFMVCRREALPGERPQRTLTEFLDGKERWQDSGASLQFALRLSDESDLIALEKFPVSQQFLSYFFQDLALTPDVGQTRRLLKLLERWLPTDQYAERLAHWIRQLAWHLTAYDLRRFHNQGANYPDANFLDDMLRRLCHASATIELSDNICRALRLGSLLRRELQDLPAPSRPTSPGENQRVNLCGEAPLADSELTDPSSRTVRLFSGTPFEAAYASSHALFREAWNDLEEERDLLELGRATYLDRPLGVFKELQGWRRDQTPLVSYRAYSRTIAAARLEAAAQTGWLEAARCRELTELLAATSIRGVAAEELPLARPRQGVVSLEDARLAGPDFVFTGSSDLGWENILFSFAWQEGEVLWFPGLVIRSPRSRLQVEPRAVLTCYSWKEVTPCVEFGLPAGVQPHEVEYLERRGQETLVCGLDVLHLWDRDGNEVTPLPEPTRLRLFR